MRRLSFPRIAADKFDSGLFLRASLSRLCVSPSNSSFATQSGTEIHRDPQRKCVFDRISSAISQNKYESALKSCGLGLDFLTN